MPARKLDRLSGGDRLAGDLRDGERIAVRIAVIGTWIERRCDIFRACDRIVGRNRRTVLIPAGDAHHQRIVHHTARPIYETVGEAVGHSLAGVERLDVNSGVVQRVDILSILANDDRAVSSRNRHPDACRLPVHAINAQRVANVDVARRGEHAARSRQGRVLQH